MVHSSQNQQATGIVNSDATDIYFPCDAPIVNVDRSAPKVTVGTATGQSQQSTGTGKLNLPKLPSGFAVIGHIMTGFCRILIGLVPLCDTDCTVTFICAAVIVMDAHDIPVLTGWHEHSGPRLCRIALHPNESNLPKMPSTSLIRYFHAAAGYPVRYT